MTTNPTVPTEEQVEQAEREMEAEYPTIVESSRFYRQALIRERAKTIQLQSEIERLTKIVAEILEFVTLSIDPFDAPSGWETQLNTWKTAIRQLPLTEKEKAE